MPSPSEMVYRNVSTPSLLPPDTYNPTASDPEFSSKIRVPSTFCGNENNTFIFKMKKTKKNNNSSRSDVPKRGVYEGKEGDQRVSFPWCLGKRSIFPRAPGNHYHEEFLATYFEATFSILHAGLGLLRMPYPTTEKSRVKF